MSYKMEVETPRGQWSSNALRFATKEEAERAGDELLSRWTVPLSSRATETPDEPVNYEFPTWADRPLPLPVPMTGGMEAV
jgi:hypothetical protein